MSEENKKKRKAVTRFGQTRSCLVTIVGEEQESYGNTNVKWLEPGQEAVLFADPCPNHCILERDDWVGAPEVGPRPQPTQHAQPAENPEAATAPVVAPPPEPITPVSFEAAVAAEPVASAPAPAPVAEVTAENA